MKIAFLKTKKQNAMYHEKIGLIKDINGDIVAFSGSMNESENAFKDNYESFDVFCSWTNDAERVFQKQMSFQAIWEDYEPGIETIDFPNAVKNKLYEYNTELRKNNRYKSRSICENLEKKAIYLPDDFHIRDYQSTAIHAWEKNGFCGIYDMATGTGKTLTALASIEYLFKKNKERLAIIIVCPYQHLVEQWVEDIVKFGIQPIIGYSKSPQNNWRKKLEQSIRSFNLKTKDMFCFVTTNATFSTNRIQTQIVQLSNDSLLVVDEAHNIGSANYRKCLPNTVKYRLALSATIDRYNDNVGTAALIDYFGKKCIEYSLKEAIENNMLSKYLYYPVLTYLDEDELETYINLTHQLAKAIYKKDGKIVLSEYAKQFLIKRSRVVSGAQEKLSALKKHIEAFKYDSHLLVYCGATSTKVADNNELGFETKQIDLVINILGNEMGMRVGRFTSQESSKERAKIKKAFAEGNILQALVAIKCLDEGVNITNIKTAFILASSTNPKEYIQRRGRVLRKFPGKDYAVIFDFVTLPFPVETLKVRSKDIVNSTRGLIKREIIRMMDFATISENPSKTYNLIYKLRYGFGITEEELKNGEENSNVI